MNRRSNRRASPRVGMLLLAAAAPLLMWVYFPASRSHIDPSLFLLLHTALEVVSVVIALTVFITGYRALLSSRLQGVVRLGIGFLGVGLLDFLHLMSYAGMPDAWTPNTPHKSIFFWLAARLLAASALLVYVLSSSAAEMSERRKVGMAAAMLAAVASIAWLGLAAPEAVPALFIQGSGLTPLKIGVEWLAVFINLATLVVLWRRRTQWPDRALHAIFLAVSLSAVSELFMTMLGVIDKDQANLIGHIYKAAAYLHLFRAMTSSCPPINARHMPIGCGAISCNPTHVRWGRRRFSCCAAMAAPCLSMYRSGTGRIAA